MRTVPAKQGLRRLRHERLRRARPTTTIPGDADKTTATTVSKEQSGRGAHKGLYRQRLAACKESGRNSYP